MNTEEFLTQDMKSVVSKIMNIMNESSNNAQSSPVLKNALQKKQVVNNKKSSITADKPLKCIRTDSPTSTAVLSKSSDTSITKLTPTNKAGLGDSQKKRINSPKFEETYARMKAYETRRDHILKKNLQISQEKINKAHTHNPVINKKSAELIRNVSPIHVRYKEVISTKKQKMSELIIKTKKEKEDQLKKELTFKPKISENEISVRSSQEYYNYMISWKNHVEKLETRERELKNEKVLEGVTFKPNIDKNSGIIAKNFPGFEERLEKGIQMREKKITEKRNNPHYSFKPEMVTKYKRLELTPVFERLYTPRGRGTSFSPLNKKN